MAKTKTQNEELPQSGDVAVETVPSAAPRQKPTIEELQAEKATLMADKTQPKEEREKRLRQIRQQLRSQGVYSRGPMPAKEAAASTNDEPVSQPSSAGPETTDEDNSDDEAF